VNYPHFAGAGLIITNNPARNAHTEDLVVLTEHAGAISWLVIQLKGIYEKSIDYSTKYAFYQSIGNLTLEALSTCTTLQSTLEYITDKTLMEWPLNNVPESADQNEEGPWP
jgi:hypothetical protein